MYDLFGGTGAWSQFYRQDPDYQVIVVDPLAKASGSLRMSVQEFLHNIYLYPKAHGVLAAPPCQNFAASNRKHWSKIPQRELDKSINNVRAALAVIKIMKPKWWALENPVGRIHKLVPEVGVKRLMFDPYEFAEYHNPSTNRYCKRTIIWGEFTRPKKKPIPPVGESPIHHYRGPRKMRSLVRSITPSGFARAYYEVNK